MRDVFRHSRFRANPSYELLERQHLSAAELELLAEVDAPDDLYGVLRPRPGEDFELRSASPDTALLFLTLEHPSPLPRYLQGQLGDDVERVIGRLALDGILEVEHEGGFLSGVEASRVLYGHHSDRGQGRVARLSVAAMRYAQELPVAEPALADRLYSYGRQPVSAGLVRRFPDDASIAAHLGLEAGGALRAALEGRWRELTPTGSGRRHWRTWHARGAGHPAGRADRAQKLYISPALDQLPAAVEAVVGSKAVARGARAWKVGAGVHGVCRPDKLVVYFDQLEDLQHAALELRDRLDGCPSHGVPFTAPITEDGLLSWGVDPAVDASWAGGAISWRVLLSQRLAHYIVVARTGSSRALQPWEFAVERLRLSGIDPDTWMPASRDWAEGAGSV